MTNVNAVNVTLTAVPKTQEPVALPTADWTTDQLKSFALERLGLARMFCRRTAEECWMSGRALYLLRPKYKAEKRWVKFVKDELKMVPKTVNTLIAIGKEFSSIEEMEGLSLVEIKTYLGLYPFKDDEDTTSPKPEKKPKSAKEDQGGNESETKDQGGNESETKDQGETKPADATETVDATSGQPQPPASNDQYQPQVDAEEELIEATDRLVEEAERLATTASSVLKTRRLDIEKLRRALDAIQRLISLAEQA